MLVIIGADEYGDKDVLGIMDGFRENADNPLSHMQACVAAQRA